MTPNQIKAAVRAGAIAPSDAKRINACVAYCSDLADSELKEGSAGAIRDDRDRLLAALRLAFVYINGGPGFTPANHKAAHDACRNALGGR